MQVVMNITNPAETVRCWVELYTDPLYAWAFTKTNQKEIAEDLVQDTFIAAYEGFEKFSGNSEVKTWLFGILHHKIADYFRKKYKNPLQALPGDELFTTDFFDEEGSWKKNQQPLSWSDDSAELLDNSEFKKVFESCFGKMPGLWQAVMQLKFLEEKKGEDLCQDLEISPTNFWQILHRAKLQLRKCLDTHWFKK